MKKILSSVCLLLLVMGLLLYKSGDPELIEQKTKWGLSSSKQDLWTEHQYTFRFNQAPILIYEIQTENSTLKAAHNPNSSSLRSWLEQNPRATLIMNGAYFNEAQEPLGGLVLKGEEISITPFDPLRSAWINFDTNSINSSQIGLNSLQSYPLLIESGEVAISVNSLLRDRRSFIGTDKAGHIYLAVTNAQISLYELATVLKHSPIAWENVLNLDGGRSTGLITHEGLKVPSLVPLPIVLMLESK